MDNELTITIPSFFYKIKEVEGFEDAVIAGGFVRDQYLGKKWKDVDIFFPVRGQQDLKDKMASLAKVGFEFKYSEETEGYENKTFRGKWDATIDGFDVDLVGQKMGTKGFGTNLVETFQFGIDRIYTDGKEVVTHPDFDADTKYRVINLRDLPKGVDDLPHAMKKYFRLKEKYPNYNFTTSYTLEKRRGDDWL